VEIGYVENGVKKTQNREVMAANGFSGQGDRRLLFGLGEAVGESIEVRVHWCGDKTANHLTLAPRQYHRLVMSKQ
jgi:hypothetical protein